MFIRIKPTGEPEININSALIRDYAPHISDETQTKVNFLGGDSMIVKASAQAVRGAIKRAARDAHQGYPESQKD